MPIFRRRGTGPWSVVVAANVHNSRFMRSLLRNDEPDSKRIGYICAAAILLVVALGCSARAKSAGGTDASDKVVSSNSGPPEVLLHEQLRSGAFQLNAATASIEETLAAAKSSLSKLPKNSSAREGMEDVVDYVDSAGSSLGEFIEEPPTKQEVAKDFAGFDERRLKAVDAATEALRDLREALGLLETIAEDPNESVIKTVLGVRSLLAVAIDDLWGAIEALGGQPEGSEEPLNP